MMESLPKPLLKIMPQLMLQQVMCSALEIIINKALSLNINSNEQLNNLEQKTLAVKLAELGFPLCFSISDCKVLVTKLIDRADCTITTSIKTLRELKKEQHLTELIKQDKLDVEGDIKIAQYFASLAETMDIDWQTELAKHIGDVATHKLVQFSKLVKGKIDFASEQIQADASEYLVHEKQLVVTKSQINHFNQAVTAVNMQTEQVENRINQLFDNLRIKT
ncbi:MAG: SCP2 sterol-binding domain-containing protein [Colwellia sp.]|nr:SCP2 sterol-binding domain-containing protein [Colwellia sp.]